jgi:hypothetical protein
VVSDNDRAALKKEYTDLPWSSANVANDYSGARDIVIDSPWRTKEGAAITLRLLRVRLEESRRIAQIQGVGREGLILEIGSEVRLRDTRWGLSAGPVYRVIEISGALQTLSPSFTLWR